MVESAEFPVHNPNMDALDSRPKLSLPSRIHRCRHQRCCLRTRRCRPLPCCTYSILFSASLLPLSPNPTAMAPTASKVDHKMLLSSRDPLSFPILSTNFKRFICVNLWVCILVPRIHLLRNPPCRPDLRAVPTYTTSSPSDTHHLSSTSQCTRTFALLSSYTRPPRSLSLFRHSSSALPCQGNVFVH